MGSWISSDGWQTVVCIGPDVGVRLTGLQFYSDHVVICGRHSRGLYFQPVTNVDHEYGFGTSKCPFCKGGDLHGKFHLYRSRKKVEQALDKLDIEMKAWQGVVDAVAEAYEKGKQRARNQ